MGVEYKKAWLYVTRYVSDGDKVKNVHPFLRPRCYCVANQIPGCIYCARGVQGRLLGSDHTCRAQYTPARHPPDMQGGGWPIKIVPVLTSATQDVLSRLPAKRVIGTENAG